MRDCRYIPAPDSHSPDKRSHKCEKWLCSSARPGSGLQHDNAVTGGALYAVSGLVCPVPGIVWRADFVGNPLGVPVNFPKPVPSSDVDQQERVEPSSLVVKAIGRTPPGMAFAYTE